MVNSPKAANFSADFAAEIFTAMPSVIRCIRYNGFLYEIFQNQNIFGGISTFSKRYAVINYTMLSVDCSLFRSDFTSRLILHQALCDYTFLELAISAKQL